MSLTRGILRFRLCVRASLHVKCQCVA